MKRIGFVIGVIISILGVGSLATPTNALTASTQNGISIQSRYSSDFASQSFKQSVDNAVKDGVNYISLVVSVHQDNKYSSSVYIDGNTASDDAIRAGVAYINSKGIKAGIAIHDDVYDGTWRALIYPTNPTQWFTSYASILNHYAQLSQSAGVSEISIATEMSSMTASNYTSSWIQMINSVRSRFSGSLTYSAQHSGYASDVMSVGFWQYLDYIGISAYYSLNGSTNQADMVAQWKKWDQQEISVISAKYNKPVIFTEVGFVSKDGSTGDPGSAYGLNTAVNTTLQATAYSALFQYLSTANEVKGIFLWDWSSDPNAGGASDGDYTPQNKPAEAVMKQAFTNSTPIVVTPANYSVSNVNPVTATANTSTTTSLNLTSSQTTTNNLIDIEVYNSNNQRVAQNAIQSQNLTAGSNNFSIIWTPSTTGTYTVKVGIFTPNWASNLYWNDNAGQVTISTPTSTTPPPVTTPPVTTPTPPTTTPTQPTPPTSPTPPVTTPLPTGLSIWWPSNGSAVSGVQPFKATIDGRDPSTYDMYWQVGGGQLNSMSTSTDGGIHKEASVDLTSWNWNSNKQYVITFIAKDKTGAIIAQKSTTITVN